jgi:hypothetical protein
MYPAIEFQALDVLKRRRVFNVANIKGCRLRGVCNPPIRVGVGFYPYLTDSCWGIEGALF